ncbi:MAG TPA: hypothetical protein VNX28_14485 [Gemmataceae bacterium]|jgi:hypothetical protein|nr:hypothetical protein [Gemmataceae bacterium]
MKQLTSDELREFHDFLGEKLANGGANISPEEALDQWRILHPDSEELTESLSAVREALADMASGDRGRPVDEVLAELRSRHNLPSQ